MQTMGIEEIREAEQGLQTRLYNHKQQEGRLRNDYLKAINSRALLSKTLQSDEEVSVNLELKLKLDSGEPSTKRVTSIGYDFAASKVALYCDAGNTGWAWVDQVVDLDGLTQILWHIPFN